MSKPRVYFSKSNECDPNDARAVREILDSLDIEIVEFTGGRYDPSIVDDCNYILFLPPKNSLNPGMEGSGKSIYDIGRGQYEQLDRFAFVNDNLSNIYIISGISRDTILVDEWMDDGLHDEEDQNWGSFWGYIETDESMQNFAEVLGLVKPESKRPATYTKNMDSIDNFEAMLAQMEMEIVAVSPSTKALKITPMPAFVDRIYIPEDGPMLAVAAHLGLI